MAIDRRAFIRQLAATTAALGLGSRARAADRPNILWITSEDNGPFLGCYGDPLAQTPNLDRMAAEGVRYTRAFANSPVCSASRSTLITGMHNISVGLQHHRSRVPLPEWVRKYPEYLREGGYYCTNNVKTDYNFVGDQKAPWDECSNKATYANRAKGQPFFAIFNLTDSHESQTFRKNVANKRKNGTFPPESRLKPEQINLPPYHPDLPEIRQEWVDYYDCITVMDRKVGELLDELAKAGLAEDTIVFYYSDHAGVVTRSKRFVYDSGTHVPMIVRFPKKWAHLAPAKPGGTVDRMVAFIDLLPTLCSLAGVPIPKQFQGTAFLGEQAGPAQDHVFLYRGRMDGRYDMTRAVRDERFRYIRNFYPQRPNGQPYIYAYNAPTTPAWEAAFKAGQCNAVQAAYFLPRPAEEFYDTAADPWEVSNLADDPVHADKLNALRAQCFADMAAVHDSGFIPEGMFKLKAGEGTIADYVRSKDYPYEAVVAVANAATSRDPGQLGKLVDALGADEPLLRYWGAVGCTVLAEQAAAAAPLLRQLLSDPVASVRIAAAEALGHLGDPERAVAALAKELDLGEDAPVLEAINALDFLGEPAKAVLPAIQALAQKTKAYPNGSEIAKQVVAKFGAA